MDVISGMLGPGGDLNPPAAPFVPAAYRAVEDFSAEWWGLVASSPGFRDYWLRECFVDVDYAAAATEEEPQIKYPFLFGDIDEASQDRKGDEGRKGMKMEVMKLGAEKWRGPRVGAVGPGYGMKAPKVVRVKVSPRTIQQPR